MANKDSNHNNKSVCEMSMLLVANIIRLSSPRFSSSSLTKKLPPPQEEERTHVAAVGKGYTTTWASKYYKSERRKPERIKRAGPSLYGTKIEKDDPTTYVRQAHDDVDINAENYISHIRGKIRDTANIEY
ncbi:hypothetical protein VNO77_04233 [Canavalia gladiata]|uniref:Uncharacterized protein n=1 Tax=Canavalia gladiata TaxID=3824 RepID=A0AAN9R7K7_CANGL